MSIVPETSSWLAWIHRGALMTSEELVLRRKVWGQGVADNARISEMIISMPEHSERWRASVFHYHCICGLVTFLFLPAYSMSVSFVSRDIYQLCNHLNLKLIGSQAHTIRSEMQTILNKHKVSLLDGLENTEQIVCVNRSHPRTVEVTDEENKTRSN